MKELTQTTNWNVGSMAQMTSREIADLTGKRHADVSRDIRVMFDDLQIDVSKSAHIYLDALNRQQTEYLLDQELTFTLVTGYSTKLRNAVIRRWLDLEHQVVSLQNELNKWCAKENFDKSIGSLHGKGLAERKKTKHLNTTTIDGILRKMQLKLEV
ncbi:Rha family transcriptional regulator [Psychrobacter sp. Arc29]|uniref:Rha family transcriptional regulator n=1 Tax=Psychrobacter sp. Arc29 TaxID=3046690 RepID=UPI00352F8ED3